MIEYGNCISVQDYNRLRNAVGWSEVEPSQVQRGLDNTAYLTVAVENGRPVGMARVVSDGGFYALIVDVIVLPSHQGNGIGKKMMQIVMDSIQAGIDEGQSVYVNLMASKDKESFYESFGFVRRPNDIGGCGMTQLLRCPMP